MPPELKQIGQLKETGEIVFFGEEEKPRELEPGGELFETGEREFFTDPPIGELEEIGELKETGERVFYEKKEPVETEKEKELTEIGEMKETGERFFYSELPPEKRRPPGYSGTWDYTTRERTFNALNREIVEIGQAVLRGGMTAIHALRVRPEAWKAQGYTDEEIQAMKKRTEKLGAGIDALDRADKAMERYKDLYFPEWREMAAKKPARITKEIRPAEEKQVSAEFLRHVRSLPPEEGAELMNEALGEGPVIVRNVVLEKDVLKDPHWYLYNMAKLGPGIAATFTAGLGSAKVAGAMGMTPRIARLMATLGGTHIGATLEASGGYKEAIDSGLSREEAFGVFNEDWVWGMALNAIGTDMMFGDAFEASVGGSAARKARSLAKKAGSYFATGNVEGATEFLEEIANAGVLAKRTGEKDWVDQAVEQGLAVYLPAGLSGALFGMGGDAIASIESKRAGQNVIPREGGPYERGFGEEAPPAAPPKPPEAPPTPAPEAPPVAPEAPPAPPKAPPAVPVKKPPEIAAPPEKAPIVPTGKRREEARIEEETAPVFRAFRDRKIDKDQYEEAQRLVREEKLTGEKALERVLAPPKPKAPPEVREKAVPFEEKVKVSEKVPETTVKEFAKAEEEKTTGKELSKEPKEKREERKREAGLVKREGLVGPELVELYGMINEGKFPQIVKKLRSRMGGITKGLTIIKKVGAAPKEIAVKLAAHIFEDAKDAMATLGHEIGHVISALPKEFMSWARGNILGRIMSVSKFMKNMILDSPTNPNHLITPEEEKAAKARIRREIKEEKKRPKAVKGTVLTKDFFLKIVKNQGTPEDLSLWHRIMNTFGPKAIKDIIKKRVTKEEIMSGDVAAEIAGKMTESDFNLVLKKYKKWYNEEVKKRGIISRDEINEELKKVSQLWDPIPAWASDKFIAYRFSPDELYADALSVFLNDPAMLRKNAPKFYNAFTNYMVNKPEVKKAYEEIQDYIAGKGREERIHKRVRRMFEKAQAVRAELREKYRQEGRLTIREKFHIELNDHRKYVFEEARRVSKMLGEKYELTLREVENKFQQSRYIDGTREIFKKESENKVSDELAKVGLDIEDLGEWMRYMAVKTYRAEVASELGMTPDVAKAQLEWLERNLEEKYKKIVDAHGNYWNLRNEYVIDLLTESKYKLYTPELMEKIKGNKYYARTNVIEYMEKSSGYSEMGTKIFSIKGTFKESENPFVANFYQDLGIMRGAMFNEAKGTALEIFHKHFPEEYPESRKVFKQGYGMVYAETKKTGYKTVYFMKDGKVQAYDVPLRVSFGFEANPMRESFFGRLLALGSAPVKKLYVQFRPGFIAVKNPLKDFVRFYRALPRTNIIQAIKVYVSQVKPAFRSVYKTPDATAKYLLKKGVLISSGNVYGIQQFYPGGVDVQEERLYRDLLKDKSKFYNFMEKQASFFQILHKRVLEPIGEFGSAVERIPKLAAEKRLKEVFPDAPESVRHTYVRKGPGSPAFLNWGTAFMEYNNAYIFSNAHKEGWKSERELFRFYKDVAEQPHAGEYWRKMIEVVILPKLILAAAFIGLFGDDVKKKVRKISDYYLGSYNCIPVIELNDGRVVFFKGIVDDQGKTFGAFWWKILRSFVEYKEGRIDKDEYGLFDNIQEMMNMVISEAPGVNPIIKKSVEASQFMTGINPYGHQGKKLIPAKEFAAYDERAMWRFFKITLNDFGFGLFMRLDTNNYGKARSTLDKWLKAPFLGDMLNRLVGVTDAGVSERAFKVLKFKETQKARKLVDQEEWILEDVGKIIDRGATPRSGHATKLYKKLVSDKKIDPIETSPKTFINRYIGIGTRIWGQALFIPLNATGDSSIEAEMIWDHKNYMDYSKAEYREMKNDLLEMKWISAKTLAKLEILERERK